METNKFFASIKSRKYLAQKELGQNYLVNSDVCKKIVDSLHLNNDDNLLEVGCGLGSLSFFVINQPCNATFIDIDDNSLNFINEHLVFSSNYSFINQNILTMDIKPYNKIIGNLPYYITTSIIEYLLLNGSNASVLILMIQKETFQRLVAPIKTKEYGPLSILIQYTTNVDLLFNVSRHDFVPEPHVDSCVIKFTRKSSTSMAADLYFVCKKMFLCRRKTILNNLKNFLHDDVAATKILENISLNPLLRPETIDLNTYIALTKQLKPYL